MLGQVGSLFAVRAIPTGSPLLAGCGAESGVELASLAHASVPGTLVLSPCRVSFLAVAAPLMEEALFRMAVLLVLRNRCSALATSTGSAFLFAFLHMANLARSAFDPTYVAVQVLVALLAGVYYATAALRSGGLWEPLLLHSVNNAVAGLLPTDADPTTCNVLRASSALQPHPRTHTHRRTALTHSLPCAPSCAVPRSAASHVRAQPRRPYDGGREGGGSGGGRREGGGG